MRLFASPSACLTATLYATRVALGAEQRIVQAERQGRGAVQPAFPPVILHDALKIKGLTTGQREAVEAGRAFALLQEQGMKTVVMSDIQRQQSERLRQAVTLAATGRASESLKLLDDVVSIPDAITTDEHGGKTRNGKEVWSSKHGQFSAGNRLFAAGTGHHRRGSSPLG